MKSIPYPPATKIPTVNRSPRIAVLMGFAALLAFPAAAQPATSAPARLTEADVVRLARERAPQSRVADATKALAMARERSAGLLPNPSLGWDREALLTGQDATKDVFRVTLPIDFARPGAERAFASAESAWTNAEASERRDAGTLEAVLAYYDLVLLENRVVILRQAVESLDEASRVLATREKAGTASGYESARLAVEKELAESRAGEARGSLLGARARLAGLLALDLERVHVDQRLGLVDLPAEETLVLGGPARREVVTHARASLRLAAAAEDRAKWTWMPTLNLSAGANIETEIETRYGYVAGLSLTLPIFDHGQRFRAEARGQHNLSRARSEALTQSVQSEVRSAYAVYATARVELQRFEKATLEHVEALLQAARSGYREGERSIVELLDAERMRSEVLERRLDLLSVAKRAEARVRAAGGLL